MVYPVIVHTASTDTRKRALGIAGRRGPGANGWRRCCAMKSQQRTPGKQDPCQPWERLAASGLTAIGSARNDPSYGLTFTISALTVSNLVALKWASDVGRNYRVQSRDDLASGSWLDNSGELNATKTNTAVTLYVGGVTNQFYRIVQVR